MLCSNSSDFSEQNRGVYLTTCILDLQTKSVDKGEQKELFIFD